MLSVYTLFLPLIIFVVPAGFTVDNKTLFTTYLQTLFYVLLFVLMVEGQNFLHSFSVEKKISIVLIYVISCYTKITL